MTIVDVGSTNGIVINGRRVQQARLDDGALSRARQHDADLPRRHPMSEMSELTLTIIRLGFLAVLWLFVLTAVSVMRSDLFGRRVAPRGGRAAVRRHLRRRGRAGRPSPPRAAGAPRAPSSSRRAP